MKICTFPKCGKKHEARGLCHAHFEQQRKGRSLTPLRLVCRRYVCSVRGCGRPHIARGYCSRHYQRLSILIGTCAACGKARRIHGRGLCHNCFAKWHRSTQPAGYAASRRKMWRLHGQRILAAGRRVRARAAAKRRTAQLALIKPCPSCGKPFRPFADYAWGRWATFKAKTAQSTRCRPCSKSRHRAQAYANHRLAIRELRDWYVRTTLPTKDPDLIEAKREQLLLNRLIRSHK